ncbi:DNA-directed DNA polymerase [Shewanella piezotolerans WP3]|uniref:DNA-directed DNA polymerase n=1 Tax=Shewanella piezotolerans (strain WP3 / JCM 13877) TaxID=225849 RepID=B8CMY6_SHEPW|nr:DNA polymerase III subunit gamma/tau [Shewanella piezotolerans]ACJ28488.1 DNA-directed DNA polymerase [Shewanella piezotolerans WP3]
MSYQVLARKWRPAKFEQMVGQSHVLHALTNALTQQRLHHAYLFSGTRGVGKTSLARLFAKGLNCEQGVTATPCGQCSACVEIAEGRFVDLIEVDAASRTKVDDTRELLDNVQYRPSRGRYKVYLIDEVHMLSRSSFNALLKTLEEPPEHVKFLLATTDPQRLPVTVLSRCLQFNLKSLTQDEISDQLTNVLTAESLEFEATALTLLAKAANGSMRDALSLTDQAIAFGAGQVKLELVQTMLGSIDEKQVIALLEALAKADVMALMQVSAGVLSFGAEPEEVLRSLLELLHQITLTQFAPAAAQMSLYSEQIKAFAQQLSPEQVQLYYQLLLTGRKDLPHAPDPKSGLEMALLRAVTFVPEQPVSKWVTDSPAAIAIPQAAAPAITQSSESAKPQAIVAPQQEVKAAPVEEAAEKKTVLTANSVNDKQPNQDPVAADTLKPELAAIEASVGAPVSSTLESMNSEMAVILSQAQSQGFSSSDTSETKDISTEQTQSEVKPPVKAQQPADTSTSDDATEISSIAEQLPKPSDIDSNLNNTVVDNASVKLEAQKGQQVQDSQFDGDDDLAAYSQYAGAYDTDIDDSDFDFALEQSEPLAQDITDRRQNAAQSAAISTSLVPSQLESQPSAEASSASDDILDAVLAARDSLLDGIGEEDPQESSAKKSVAERKPFAPPVRKPKAEPEIDNSDPATVGAKSDQAQENIKAANADNQEETFDRPPWEEPHAQDPTPRFDDVAVEKEANKAADNAAVEPKRTPQPQNQTEQQSKPPVTSLDSTSVQDVELNLPALPSGEITGNDIDLKWYRFMADLEVGGRVRQLAVNSVCHQFEQPLSLLLKPDQKHLGADVAIKQLEEAMSKALGEPSEVRISVGVDSSRETPLEVRRRFHKEILAQAHHGMITDDNVRWLSENMGAQLTPDSLSYAPELLVNKGKSIELVDMSNFKRLPES